jgi:hypothetical protein
VAFKPANALLLGLVEDGEPTVLRCLPRRRGVEGREPGYGQQVAKQHRRQLSVLIL